MAARSCAQTLLAGCDAPAGLMAQARLVLTAACLHLHARVGPDPTLGELRDFVLTLGPGAGGWTALGSSPIQFVRYTAAELADADGALGSAIKLAAQAIAAMTL